MTTNDDSSSCDSPKHDKTIHWARERYLDEVMRRLEEERHRKGSANRFGPEWVFELTYQLCRDRLLPLYNAWLFIHWNRDVTDDLKKACKRIGCDEWADYVRGDTESIGDEIEDEHLTKCIFDYVIAHGHQILSGPLPDFDEILKSDAPPNAEGATA
jgi:hypothetical protein